MSNNWGIAFLYEDYVNLLSKAVFPNVSCPTVKTACHYASNEENNHNIVCRSGTHTTQIMLAMGAVWH